jgi:hypothetical protein
MDGNDSSSSLTPSRQRVLDAIAFRAPDRLPRWDNFDIFGDFSSRWRRWKGLGPDVDPAEYYGIDCGMCMCDEGPFFSQTRPLRHEGGYDIVFDSWGRTLRQKPGAAWFMETVETLLEDPAALDRLEFEDTAADARYGAYLGRIAAERQAGRLAFTKVGGVYVRSQFMRREDRLLIDMALDPGFCDALFGRMGDHLTRIALEELRRSDSWETGIWFYDDCANVLAPMFSPAMWERYLQPVYARMIATLRAAGCRHFYLHSDGNIMPLIPLMLDVGLEGFNPLEPRSNDLAALRAQYGQRIVFFGGVCNTRILPRGDRREIEAHVRALIELGREGGLIIGQASLGEDISPAAYDTYMTVLREHAQFR